MKGQLLLDTNVLVRFLTGQPPAMASKARRLFASAAEGTHSLHLFPLIVAETVYTLESYYKMDRRDVSEIMSRLVSSGGIHCHERERVLDALKRHHDHNIAFADAYLAAAGCELGIAVASFDREFDRFNDVTRFEPVD